MGPTDALQWVIYVGAGTLAGALAGLLLPKFGRGKLQAAGWGMLVIQPFLAGLFVIDGQDGNPVGMFTAVLWSILTVAYGAALGLGLRAAWGRQDADEANRVAGDST